MSATQAWSGASGLKRRSRRLAATGRSCRLSIGIYRLGHSRCHGRRWPAGTLAQRAPSLNVPLLALSIGCGSLFFNYANHAGFWMMKESFGMTMGEATKAISVVQSIVAVTSLIVLLLFNMLPALG